MTDVTRQTICIVDDDRTTASLLAMALEDDYDILFAESGEEALSMVRSQRPELVLLDIVMPDLSGYDVCEELKADSDTRDIPIIFATGLEDSFNEEYGLQLGAADYISKPINPAVVRARVSRVLELSLYCQFMERLLSQQEATIDSMRRDAAALLARSA